MRAVIAIPTVAGVAAAAADTITHDSGVSLALLIGGISVSLALAWFARGDHDKLKWLVRSHIKLEKTVNNLYCVKRVLDKQEECKDLSEEEEEEVSNE